nr:hypothetical protein [Bacteroidota bacterium]
SFTGTLDVDGVTDFNNNVNINNGSNLQISGDMIVGGATIFENDLTVNGDTNLNNALNVNNGSPTQLSGLLEVGGQARLASTLLTLGSANLGGLVRVNNGSNVFLSGTLEVGLATNLNSRLQVNNGADTYFSGALTVNGLIDFGDDLTVDGITNFNDDLNVLNGATMSLSGNLSVDGDTAVNGKLTVIKETILNDNMTVTNGLETTFTGALLVDNPTLLNSDLIVTNQYPTALTGTLTVDQETLLNSSLEVMESSTTNLSGSLLVTERTKMNDNMFVENGSTTRLSGLLRVEGESNLNELNVINGSETSLTGTLDVDGETNLNNALNVQLQAILNNDLNVTGSANLAGLTSEGIAVTSDNANAVATFNNTNTQDGDGIAIKLGRNHGAWDGSNLVQVPNPILAEVGTSGTTYNAGVTFLRGQLQNPGNITFNEAIGLAPAALEEVAKNSFLNQTFIGVNDYMNLPVPFPDLNMPGQLLSNEIEFYGGNSAQCSGQYCFSICFPFAGCVRVCIPPVNICVPAIPRIAFPGIDVPTIPLPNVPNPSNYFPALPINFPTANVPQVTIPNIPNLFNDNLSKDNEYIKFTDKDDRQTGVIRANSTTDFINNTALDNLYVLNVLSNFIGVDLVEGQVAGTVGLINYIDEFNKLGVEYSSGNGDYAEWLERVDASEIILPGDIVAVKGGKITKNMEGFEQLMVASHHPIIQGNTPEVDRAHLGNSVAFIGQVPVKIIGAVRTGDYVLVSKEVPGYGIAKSKTEMMLEDYNLVVGRAWQENLNNGPKIVNVVVGLQQGDFNSSVQQLQEQQKDMDEQLETLAEKLTRLELKIDLVTQKEQNYATKE